MRKIDLLHARPSTLPWRRGLPLLFLLLTSQICSANIELPLQGYYRTGRYIPVRTDTDISLLHTDGIFPTIISSNNSTIVPVLITGLPAVLTQSIQLHPVGNDEKLVAFDGNNLTAAQTLFSHSKLLGIPVNSFDPLPGPPVAWESLDAVILDPHSLTHLNDAQRSALLSAGTIIATPAVTAPDAIWPWRRRGNLMVLEHENVGPADQIILPGAYSPSEVWLPHHSKAFHRGIFIAAIFVAIGVIGLAMWPSRIAPLAIVLFLILAATGFSYWRFSLGIVRQAGGEVVVFANSLLQRDTWICERANAGGIRRIPWEGSTHPIFASREQMEKLNMRLIVSASGETAFEYDAMPGETVVFMKREIVPGGPPSVISSIKFSSPMRDLAREIYLPSTPYRIVGDLTGNGGQWDGILLRSARVNPAN